MGQSIMLGKKYRDNVHGFEGIATAKVEYLHGCSRVLLERLNENQELKELWFDEPQIEGCEQNTQKPGGGKNPPSMH